MRLYWKIALFWLSLPPCLAWAADSPEPIYVYSANSKCQFVAENGWLNFVPQECNLLYAPNFPPSPLADPVAETARQNATHVYHYFREKHGWNSYDGAGSPLVSIVHAGTNWVFAGWYPQGKYMVYGDGDGKTYRSLAYASDVAAHEFTHGVSQTLVGLVAQGDSGAVNEAIADFFSVVITDNQDWNLGCGLYMPGVQCRPFRCIADPNHCPSWGAARYSQRKAASPPCNGKNDFCEMHTNSTIISHALYLMTLSLDRDKVARLVFEAMRSHMRPDTGFPEAAEALRQTCDHLYDKNDCAAVSAALDQVEL